MSDEGEVRVHERLVPIRPGEENPPTRNVAMSSRFLIANRRRRFPSHPAVLPAHRSVGSTARDNLRPDLPSEQRKADNQHRVG